MQSCKAREGTVTLPARKVRVEVFDQDGNRFTIAFEGRVTREKVLQVLDLVELLGGVPKGGSMPGEGGFEELSAFDRLKSLLEKQFPIVWFSSREVQRVYEDMFNAPIGLSTVSTYLARLVDRGALIRGGSLNERKYRLRRGSLAEELKI